MRLTWHIVWKDLTRLRLPLALWVALFLSEFALGARLLSASAISFPVFERIQSSDAVLYALRVAAGYLLVAALVFEDPLVGTTAFWPTRPISGGRLMGAKLLSCLVVFGLLPILVTLPWWLYCGYGGQQVYEASLDMLGSQIMPVAIGFLLAVLTGSMSRFLLWTALSAAAVALSIVLFAKPAATHLYIRGMDVIVDSPGESAARFRALCLVAAAGWFAVVAHQFLTRRLIRSLAVLAFAAGLLGAEAEWWPLTLGFRSRETQAPAAADPLDDRVSIHLPKKASLHLEQNAGASTDTVVFGNLKVEEAPPQLLMRFDDSAFEWRWSDGSSARAQGTLLGIVHPSFYQLQSVVPHKEPSASTWEQSAEYRSGKPRSYDALVTEYPYPANRLWDYYVQVSRPDGLRMLSDPPSCTIDLRGVLLEPKLNCEIPLAGGNGWAGRGEGFRVARSEWNERSNMLEVFVVEHRAAIGGLFNPYEYSNRLNYENTYFAINRRRGDSAWPVSYGNFNLSIRIATVAIAWRSLTFAGPSELVVGFHVLDYGRWTGPSYKDWFSDATLGRVVETAAGRFSRKVTIDRFSLTPDLFSRAP